MFTIYNKQIIETERLRMEPFSSSHTSALNALNADPDIMRYIGEGTTETLEETKATIERVSDRWKRFGYSWWVLIQLKDNEIVGSACVQNLAHKAEAPLEIGWRLIPKYQGLGFATEAGQAAIEFAFGTLGATYLVAVAHPQNKSSHRVMERLGMNYVGIEEHYDQPCIVYDINKPKADKTG